MYDVKMDKDAVLSPLGKVTAYLVGFLALIFFYFASSRGVNDAAGTNIFAFSFTLLGLVSYIVSVAVAVAFTLALIGHDDKKYDGTVFYKKWKMQVAKIYCTFNYVAMAIVYFNVIYTKAVYGIFLFVETLLVIVYAISSIKKYFKHMYIKENPFIISKNQTKSKTKN